MARKSKTSPGPVLLLWRDGPEVRAQFATRAFRPPRGWRVVAELFGAWIGHGLVVAAPAKHWTRARRALAEASGTAPERLPAEPPRGPSVREVN